MANRMSSGLQAEASPYFSVTSGGSSAYEVTRVEAQMVLHKGGDEVIAVVVTGLHAYFNRVLGGATGFLNQVRHELLFKEVIRCTLIDQYGSMLGGLTQQHTGVVV
jgi:hypothetical protein